MSLHVRVPVNYSADGNLTLRLICVLNQAETAETSEVGSVGNTEHSGNGSQTRTAHDENAGDGVGIDA